MRFTIYRLSVVIILFLGLGLRTSAQQSFTVKGVIFKKNTPEIVAMATISNLNRKTSVLSDELGGFSIQASLGDTLLFKKADFAVQTILVQSYLNLSVYLQPVIHLNEVTIKDYSRQKELSNVLDDYKKKGQYYTLDPSAMSVISSPLSGLYEIFGKGAAQARRFREYSRDEQERAAVSKRYNRTLVKKVIEIPDNELEDFMFAFTPSYEDIKVWSDYDIITYIKKSYEYFKHNKEQLKLEKLY